MGRRQQAAGGKHATERVTQISRFKFEIQNLEPTSRAQNPESKSETLFAAKPVLPTDD
jgi:hypothetical protein